jgi:hypothetical protein
VNHRLVLHRVGPDVGYCRDVLWDSEAYDSSHDVKVAAPAICLRASTDLLLGDDFAGHPCTEHSVSVIQPSKPNGDHPYDRVATR